MARNSGGATGGGSGGGLPSGGLKDQVPIKESNTTGDWGFTNTALLSNNTPLAPSGVGSPGTATDGARSDHVHPAVFNPFAIEMPSGALAETMPKVMTDNSSHPVGLTGVMPACAIPLPAGAVINAIHFFCGGPPGTAQTHLWAAILDNGPVVRGVTNDLLAVPPTANTQVDLTLTAPYTVPSAGLYFVGLCWVFTGTTPNIAGKTMHGREYQYGQALKGNVASSLTTPVAVGTDYSGTRGSWGIDSDMYYFWVT